MKKAKCSLVAILSVFVIMVCCTGIAYAIYSDVYDDDNSTDVRYNTLTPQGITSEVPWFSKTINYNTHITVTQASGRTITYTLDPSQITEITVSTADHDVILLGEVIFKIEQVGGSDDYSFTMNNVTGTMTGTFYTSVATSEDNVTYSAWDNKAYVIGTGVTYSDIDPDSQYVKLRLYVDASFQPADSALQTMPLNGVKFSFTVNTDE